MTGVPGGDTGVGGRADHDRGARVAPRIAAVAVPVGRFRLGPGLRSWVPGGRCRTTSSLPGGRRNAVASAGDGQPSAGRPTWWRGGRAQTVVLIRAGAWRERAGHADRAAEGRCEVGIDQGTSNRPGAEPGGIVSGTVGPFRAGTWLFTHRRPHSTSGRDEPPHTPSHTIPASMLFRCHAHCDPATKIAPTRVKWVLVTAASVGVTVVFTTGTTVAGVGVTVVVAPRRRWRDGR